MITNKFTKNYFCAKVNKNDKQLFFRSRLLQWNVMENNREMPWKGEKDPYKIWLSEVILQQTRVEQGLEYYNRFIKKYPRLTQLAAAPDTEVFKLWEGLGYYSRCKNLLSSARFIAKQLKGKFPHQFEDMLALKGVGTYTASAIASFAFELPYAVVDGNVSRVLARFFGIDTAIDSTAGKKLFAELARQLLDEKAPGKYNQAIMDFGATVCKPQLPLCTECPLQTRCDALATGTVNELPVKEKKLNKKNRWFYYIIAEYEKKIFIRKRVGKDIWQNLHEFILVEEPHQTRPEKILEGALTTFPGLQQFTAGEIAGPFRQQLTHQTIHAVFIHLKLKTATVVPGYELMDKKTMAKLAFPRLINIYLGQV